jgi:integrase
LHAENARGFEDPKSSAGSIYASFLMAAGYTLRELREYMGHSSLQATERYVKLLPPPAGPDGAADRLNAYLAARKAGS